MRKAFTLVCLLLAAAALHLLTGCSTIENAMFDARGMPPGRVSLIIDLGAQQAYLMAGDEAVLSAPISSGREGHDTRPGRYEVIEKDVDHQSSAYGEYIRDGQIVQHDVDRHKDPRPPGATFVGAPMPYFLRIYDGVGMHEGYLPGYPASHGCIRLPEAKAKRFFAAVRVGTPVIVRL